MLRLPGWKPKSAALSFTPALGYRRASLRPAVPPSPTPEGFVDTCFVVEPNYDGWRLDLYLCEKIRRLSRSRIQRIIERGVLCEAKKLKPSTLVTPGLTFFIRRKAEVEPETPTELGEVHLDDWLLIVDKPAGLPMHPSARYHAGTLVTLVREKYGTNAEGHTPEPAHRLDRETSGLVVLGRSPEACRRLMRTFVQGDVKKQYLAICEGQPPEDSFEIDAPIAEGTDLIRIAVRIDPEHGKPAKTRFRVLERFERDGAKFSLVRCFPETGRQHQIRIHLHTAGFPLVGDKMYGPDPGYFDRFSRKCLEPEAWAQLRLSRHALHAAAITFQHPGNGGSVTFESPLPADLAAFLSGAPLPVPRSASEDLPADEQAA